MGIQIRNEMDSDYFVFYIIKYHK